MLALAALAAARPAPLLAHDPGLSVVELRVETGGLSAELAFSPPDIDLVVPLDADRDGRVTAAELAAARPALERLARKMLDVRLGGRPAAVERVDLSIDETGGLRVRLHFVGPPGDLYVRSAVLARLSRGHKQYIVLRNAQGRVVAERILDARSDAFDADVRGATWGAQRAGSFREFVALGIEHILAGYDHLAFLLCLLLAGGTFREAAKIITSFTLAHSITLALATLDVIRLPPTVVEPLIAASIVYVAVENVVREAPPRRWLLTFGFGLVHGFGFASVLRDLGIGADGGGIAVPLLSFNLGVELGQLAVAAVALPLIWRLGRSPDFATRVVPACSILVALIGAYWLVQRTLLT